MPKKTTAKSQSKTATGSSSKSSSHKLREQLESISGKILQVEKSAEKQLKEIFDKTNKTRSEQLKKVQSLMKEAKRMDSAKILSSAEKLRKEIESRAEDGLESVFKKLKIGTHKEVDSLKKKISTLEKRIRDLEKVSDSPSADTTASTTSSESH